MNYKCYICAARLSPKHYDAQLQTVTCHACGNVSDYSPAAAIKRLKDEQGRNPISRPKGILEAEGAGELIFMLDGYFPPLAYEVVIGFAILFGIGVIAPLWGAPTIMFPILAAPAISGLLYYILVAALNFTQLRVTADQLEITVQPLPWVGGRLLDRSDVMQFYGLLDYRTKNELRALEDSTKRRWGREIMSVIGRDHYELHALLLRGERKCLLRSLPSAEHAIYLEQRMEEFWAIDDEPVRGQLR